jgi:AraC-like DNA-binding protein
MSRPAVEIPRRSRLPPDSSIPPRSSIPQTNSKVEGIDIDWLCEGPIVGLGRWWCHEVDPGLTKERAQHWRVIGFVHAGAYELRSPRGTALIDPTRVAFLKAGEPYRTRHPCGCGDRGSSLIVRDDVLREIVAVRRPDLAASEEGPFLEASGPAPSRAVLRQRLLLRRIESGARLDRLSVEETALQIAAEIVDAAFTSEAAVRPAGRRRSDRDLAEEARQILGREFRGPIGLSDLARAVGASPYHLLRVFRAATGIPVHRYLNRLRLHAAMEALEAGERDLSGLAFDLGFSSHSHFTFAFRREFGRPPSRFRRSDAPDLLIARI